MRDDSIFASVLRALKKQPPCELFKCEFFDQCKKEYLACKSFQFYVQSGNSKSPYGREDILPPTRKMYNKIFHEDEE